MFHLEFLQASMDQHHRCQPGTMAVMAVMNRSRGHGVHRTLGDGHVAQVDLPPGGPGGTFSITILLGGSSYIVCVGYNPSYSTVCYKKKL
jgi:hypothetical protein